jgi:hypothetical protein
MKGSLFKLDCVAPLITDSPLASSTLLSKKNIYCFLIDFKERILSTVLNVEMLLYIYVTKYIIFKLNLLED